MPSHVLVVDQNPLVQTTIENSLNSGNCEVTSVRDALSGLDLAYKIKPDLMIADLRMEGLMVYSFCARVKQKAFLSHIPIFLLVQQNDVFDEARLRQSGVVGFIQKPVDPAKLKESVRTFLTPKAESLAVEPSPVPVPGSFEAELGADAAGNGNRNGQPFDRTAVEAQTPPKGADSPRDETIKINDLMEWAQPEVSPFSEVISGATAGLNDEVTQFADTTVQGSGLPSGSHSLPEDLSEVTQLAEPAQFPMESNGKKNDDFLADLLHEPEPDLTSTESVHRPSTDSLREESSVLTDETRSKSIPLAAEPPADGNPASPSALAGLSPEMSAATREIIEKVAWEVVPYLTEQAIKNKLISDMIEKVIWEILPPLAEQSVKAAIKKISEDQASS
jgi:CheY-like chemotaxis protein